jgi:hypothetical protein
MQFVDPLCIARFAANDHQGSTLYAEVHGECSALEYPYSVLNGAQTITSLAKFIESYDPEKAPAEHGNRLDAVRVLAKIVTHAPQPFITAVTINTNRQNPVDPANLRASDQIQLELQDKFRDELSGLLYERQEKLFESLSEEEMMEQGFDPSQNRAIELKRLARTFLAAQGEVDRMSRLNDMFETESQYRACFAEKYLKSDARRILLAYKIQYRLGKVAREIDEAAKGYWYVPRAKNLLWTLLVQGVLNHRQLPAWLEAYGTTISVETDFTQELVSLGVQKVRHVIREAVSEQRYKEQLDDLRLSFLRTKALYTLCMEVAERRYEWTSRGCNRMKHQAASALSLLPTGGAATSAAAFLRTGARSIRASRRHARSAARASFVSAPSIRRWSARRSCSGSDWPSARR